VIRTDSGATRTPLIKRAPGNKQTESRGSNTAAMPPPPPPPRVPLKPKVDYDELAKGILGTEIFDDSAQKATETVLWNTHLMEGPIANILIGNDKTVGRLLLKSFLKSKSFERAVKKLSEKLVEKKVRKVLVANGVIKVLEVNDDSDETDGETEFLI